MNSNAKCKMQNAKWKWLPGAVVLHFAFCILNYTVPAEAQIGRTITEIVVEQEGRPVTDPVIAGLIETRVGTPLDAKDVRETIAHIMSLNRFDDVQVSAEDAGTGIRVRYVLTPLHPVDRIEFEGMLVRGRPSQNHRRSIRQLTTRVARD
jgi:outer membrane protein assembly factor BamA